MCSVSVYAYDKCKCQAEIERLRTTIVGVVNVRGLLGVIHCDRFESFFSKPFCQSRPLDYFHCEISHCTAGGYVESSDVFLVLRLYLVLEIT